MIRHLVLFLLLLAGIATFAATTVVLNGKTVTVPVIESNGKAYIDAAALMKLLGGSASFNAAGHKLVISTTAAQPTKAAASQGTAQLPGDNGELGKIYTMNQDQPLYFSLQRAEYTTTHLVIGDRLIAPEKDKKLLVLHFTVQNPQKTELFVRFDSLHITAVDAMNVNHEGYNAWGDAENHQNVALSLKPAQKIAAYTAVVVPAKGVIPKLMVLPRGDKGPVLRYDLRDKVAGISAPIADPADATGATALETVPGTAGVSYPYANFDMTMEQFSYSTDTLNGKAPEKGGRFLLATVLIKNRAPFDTYLRFDRITPEVTDADGALLRYNFMFFATRDAPIAQEIKAGQEMRVRLVFSVPQGSNPNKLTLKEGKSRTYEFAIQ